MGKKILKKLIAFIMLGVLMFSMAACGTKQDKKEEKGNQKTEDTTENTEEMVYESTEISLDGLKGEIDSLCVKNDRIYLLTKDGEKDREGFITGPVTARIYTAKIDGSDMKEIPLPTLKENEYVNDLMVDANNNILYYITSEDEKNGGIICYMVKMDEQGKEVVKEDVTSSLEISEEGYLYAFHMVMDDSGSVIIASGEHVSVLDENLKQVFEVESDYYLENVVKTKDGTIMVIGSSNNKDGLQAQVLDLDKKEWGESYPLNIKAMSYEDLLLDGLEYDFYYKNDSGMYGYDIKTKGFTKIIDYIASNINGTKVSSMVPLKKNEFIGSEVENELMTINVYHKADASKIAEKQTIVLGVFDWLDNKVKDEVIKFNRKNKEYRIEIKEYDSQDKLNMDVMAGNVPDILYLENLPVSQYAAKGMLEDLMPYFDKDSEINTSDMIDSVLEAMKIDGKLYYVCPECSVSTIVASAKDVGKESGWTFEDLKALLDKKGDNVRPFGSEDKGDMLSSLLGNGTSDFIDWKTGECSFDSQEFKDILELCNTGKNEEMEFDEETPSLYAEVKAGNVLLMEGTMAWTDIQFDKALFHGDITCIGYPNKEKEGSYFSLRSNMGMYSKSKVKDGAWEFLRTFMTKEYQGTNGAIIPTRKDCLDMVIKENMATTPYTDEFGREIQPWSESFGGDLQMELKPFSQEEIDIYINLINNTKKIQEENSFVMEIIEEEVKAYFAGDKTVDETVGIIQNRVNTYVNENR